MTLFLTIFYKNGEEKQKMRLSKIFEAFKEAISRLPSPPSDDQTLQNT
jgi:hypothetical protein